MSNKLIEVTGYVDKEETVNTISKSKISGTFVLEINYPFPGYYAETMEQYAKPRAILFISKKQNSWETVLRCASKFNEKLGMNINASVAEIRIEGKVKVYNAIRIKGIEKFEQIEPLQQAFVDDGIEFAKSWVKYDDKPILLKVKKFFSVEEVKDGIYQDQKQSEMAYIEIPYRPSWKLFRKMSKEIKYNSNTKQYDVALATFYMNNGIKDMIRIYKPNHTLTLIEEIKKSYWKEMEKYKED